MEELLCSLYLFVLNERVHKKDIIVLSCNLVILFTNYNSHKITESNFFYIAKKIVSKKYLFTNNVPIFYTVNCI